MIWYPCEHPERRFDDDVRFHGGLYIQFHDGDPRDPGTRSTAKMPTQPCHACDVARLAAKARGDLPEFAWTEHDYARPTTRRFDIVWSP